jgi:hypothetical protein
MTAVVFLEKIWELSSSNNSTPTSRCELVTDFRPDAFSLLHSPVVRKRAPWEPGMPAPRGISNLLGDIEDNIERSMLIQPLTPVISRRFEPSTFPEWESPCFQKWGNRIQVRKHVVQLPSAGLA